MSAKLVAALADTDLTDRRIAVAANTTPVTVYAARRGVPVPPHVARSIYRALRQLNPDPPPDLPTVDDCYRIPATGDPHWVGRALCNATVRNVDPDLWWPETSMDTPTWPARRICGDCPVLGDCRDAWVASKANGTVDASGMGPVVFGTTCRQRRSRQLAAMRRKANAA